MRRQFKEGDLVEVIADTNNHGIEIGQPILLDKRQSSNTFWASYRKPFETKSRICIISEWDIKYPENKTTDEADINAEIQAALDPHSYASLTEFNRVSYYEGGGFVNLSYGARVKTRD